MSEDIAFKIQLGLILPKLKDKISGEMSAIIEELAEIVKAGSIDDKKVPMDAVAKSAPDYSKITIDGD